MSRQQDPDNEGGGGPSRATDKTTDNPSPPPDNTAQRPGCPHLRPPRANAIGAAKEQIDPALLEAARSVGRSAARVVLERPGANAGKNARRDVHRKHHGCVWGWLRINNDLDPKFRHGAFAVPGKTFRVWIRFSSSSKHAQSDKTPDGRGVAVKLLDVGGDRLEDSIKQDIQDFLFINGPAFFAATAFSMVEAARLEADDTFPSNFFVSSGNLNGLAALLKMSSSQGDSPLDLTYYSQAPFQHGPDLVVKHRLRPANQSPSRKSLGKNGNYLFEALRSDLAPKEPPPPIPDQPQQDDFRFEFAVQPRGTPDNRYPLDDATVVWDELQSPFVPVAELIIPKQQFDTTERMNFAEHMSFNPWNGLRAHRPLGSINLARLHAYRDSLAARHRLNDEQQELDYAEAWQNLRNASNSKWIPPELESPRFPLQIGRAIASVVPWLGAAPARVFASPWGYLFAPAMLLAGLVWGEVQKPSWYCAPVRLGPNVPSEAMIPPAEFTPVRIVMGYDDAKRREADPVWNFRYGSVGAEGNGGIPYWLHRALPRMFPQYFGSRGDWSEFGLQLQDDNDYYVSYHGLPRGLILTQPVVNLGGTQFTADLRMVTFNCASCHRGEYTDPDGKPTFVDGMPNGGIDTAGYKLAAFNCFKDDNFTGAKVIAAIDELLAEEHARRPKFENGNDTPSRLTPVERLLYEAIVGVARDEAASKPLQWLEDRPPNGPGRLDAFGALRFEFLGYANEVEVEHIATVDLPSIWHQQAAWRPWHHWDGNTDQGRARNFGAIVGIGGRPETLKKEVLRDVGRWIDQELEPTLKPPRFPFGTEDHRRDSEIYKQGKEIYTDKCARCHGDYEEDGALKKLTPCMTRAATCLEESSPRPDACKDDNAQDAPQCDGYKVCTDSYRYQAITKDFVDKLNTFGANASLWSPNAFQPATGYLCPPLDGIWARAPFLHNGSVPSLWDLLGPPKDRASPFHRGNPAYDVAKGGFVSDKPAPGRRDFVFETNRDGNSNAGHNFVISDAAQRKALITYLQTL